MEINKEFIFKQRFIGDLIFDKECRIKELEDKIKEIKKEVRQLKDEYSKMIC